MDKAPGQTVALCACGEIKGSDNCCNGDAEKCDGCGQCRGICLRHDHARVAYDFGKRAAVARDHRHATGHGFRRG